MIHGGPYNTAATRGPPRTAVGYVQENPFLLYGWYKIIHPLPVPTGMVSGEAQSGTTGSWDGNDLHPARCLMSKRAQPQIPHLHATGRHPDDVLTSLQTLPWAHVRTKATKVFQNHG
jgi:hypothetical protein